MKVNCVWEHNGNDTLLYAIDHIGAYTRGENLETAMAKMPEEIASYLRWLGEEIPEIIEIEIIGLKDYHNTQIVCTLSMTTAILNLTTVLTYQLKQILISAILQSKMLLQSLRLQ